MRTVMGLLLNIHKTEPEKRSGLSLKIYAIFQISCVEEDDIL